MACLITALTRSVVKKTTRKSNKISKNKNVTAKTKYLNLKAPSNNVKLQSDKTLTTHFYFFLTTQQMKFELNNSTERRNNEVKFENQSTIFKPTVVRK